MTPPFGFGGLCLIIVHGLSVARPGYSMTGALLAKLFPVKHVSSHTGF